MLTNGDKLPAFKPKATVSNDLGTASCAGQRMNVMANPGVDKVTFGLAWLAVSAINGCGACMDSHERTPRQQDIDAQGVQSALKIAAVVHAVAVTLERSNPESA